jgi:hypothetical protein
MIVARILSGGELPMDVAPFRPDRFKHASPGTPRTP